MPESGNRILRLPVAIQPFLKRLPVSCCTASVSGTSARAIASLSVLLRKGKAKNEGAVCIGPAGTTTSLWRSARLVR